MNESLNQFKKTVKTLALDGMASIACIAFLVWLILPHRKGTRNAF